MRDSDLRAIPQTRLPFGLEAAQLRSLLARAFQLLSGFITLGLVAYFFDLKTQGYFFTFNSLIALQVFAEMGLGIVLIQFAAHEMANLKWTDAGTLEGDATARARLRSLLIFALGWSSIAAILLTAILIPAGAWFFERSAAKASRPANLLLHWNLLVVFVSGNLVIAALFNLIEGTGRVSEIATVRLVQYATGALVCWPAIALGAGLLALAMQQVVMLVIGVLYLLNNRRPFILGLIRAKLPAHTLNWRREVLPFQWRVAVSWLSGYFVFQYTTPLLFSTHGPEAAGRMGMTMQIFSAISSLCIIFVSARMPAFGQMVANRKRVELEYLFKRSVVQSFVSLVAMLILALVILALVSRNEPEFATRLLPWGQSFVLALACVGSHIVYAQSIYLRAHKQEPFMKLSVINGMFMAFLSTWAVPMAGTAGAVAAYAFVTLAISMPIGTWIYYRFEPDVSGGQVKL